MFLWREGAHGCPTAPLLRPPSRSLPSDGPPPPPTLARRRLQALPPPSLTGPAVEAFRASSASPTSSAFTGSSASSNPPGASQLRPPLSTPQPFRPRAPSPCMPSEGPEPRNSKQTSSRLLRAENEGEFGVAAKGWGGRGCGGSRPFPATAERGEVIPGRPSRCDDLIGMEPRSSWWETRRSCSELGRLSRNSHASRKRTNHSSHRPQSSFQSPNFACGGTPRRRSSTPRR